MNKGLTSLSLKHRRVLLWLLVALVMTLVIFLWISSIRIEFEPPSSLVDFGERVSGTLDPSSDTPTSTYTQPYPDTPNGGLVPLRLPLEG